MRMYLVSRLGLDKAIPIIETNSIDAYKVSCITKAYIGGRAHFLHGGEPTFMREDIFHLPAYMVRRLMRGTFLNFYHTQVLSSIDKDNFDLQAERALMSSKVSFIHQRFVGHVTEHVKAAEFAGPVLTGQTQEPCAMAIPLARKRVRFQ